MAKKTTKRVSAKQQAINKAYAKERNRVLSFINRAEKRGFRFPENVVPAIPKRKTQASIRKLEKLSKEYLYSKAEYGGEATFGEVVSGKEGLKIERQVRSKKAAQTRKEKKQAEEAFWTSSDGTKTPVTDEPVLAYVAGVDDLVDQLKDIISTMDVYYYTTARGTRARRKPDVADRAAKGLQEIMSELDSTIEEVGMTIWSTLSNELKAKFKPEDVGKNKVGEGLKEYWEEIQAHLGTIHYDSDGGAVEVSILAVVRKTQGVRRRNFRC